MRSHAWNSWNRQLGVAGRPCLHVPLPTNAFHMYKSLGCLSKKNPHVATAERKQELMVQLIECSWCVLSRSCFAHRLAVDTTKVSLAYWLRSCYFEGYWLPCPGTIGIREIRLKRSDKFNKLNKLKKLNKAQLSNPAKKCCWNPTFKAAAGVPVAELANSSSFKLSELYGDSQRFPRVCGGKPILYQSMTFVLLLCIFVD